MAKPSHLFFYVFHMCFLWLIGLPLSIPARSRSQLLRHNGVEKSLKIECLVAFRSLLRCLGKERGALTILLAAPQNRICGNSYLNKVVEIACSG